MDSRTGISRRGMLTGSAVAVGLPTATFLTRNAAGQEDAYDGFLEDDDTFEGVTHDATGREEVEVTVGVQGNQGPNAYDPSAIVVDPGTAVQWVWTGNGFHDVAADDESFQSDGSGDEGFEFEQTFDEPGVNLYFCSPHQNLGMKGVIVVGEEHVETELVAFGQHDDSDAGVDDGTADVDPGADESADDTDDGTGADDDGPGFGVFGALASLGGASYLVKRQLDSESEE